MGKWGLSDTIANDESFLSFGQLSFGVPDVGGPEAQPQVTVVNSRACCCACSQFPAVSASALLVFGGVDPVITRSGHAAVVSSLLYIFFSFTAWFVCPT